MKPVITWSSEERDRDLEEAVVATMAASGNPGTQVAVRHGERVLLAGFGWANTRESLVMTARTVMPVASITKTLTGAMIVRLADQGLIDLDAPVRAYVPELALRDETVAAQVTPRDLLTHAGGWDGDLYDEQGSCGRGDDALARFLLRLAELPQIFPLRRFTAYNNAGLCIAGRIIERVTGRPYEDVTHEELLRPLGMERSSFFVDNLTIFPLASPHFVGNVDQPRVVRPPLSRAINATGGLWSTAEDVLAYASALLPSGSGRGDALSPPVVERLLTPSRPGGTLAQSIGLSWWIDRLGETDVAFHEGDIIVTQTRLTVVPAREFAIVVLANSNVGASVHRFLTAWALDHYLGLKPTLAPVSATMPHPPGDYIGIFGYETPRTRGNPGQVQNFEVVHSGNGCTIRLQQYGTLPASPEYALAPVAMDEFRLVGGPFSGASVLFHRDDDGLVRWMDVAGRIRARVAPTNSLRA